MDLYTFLFPLYIIMLHVNNVYYNYHYLLDILIFLC